MPIGRSQMKQQIEGKVKGAKASKAMLMKKKNKKKKNG